MRACRMDNIPLELIKPEHLAQVFEKALIAMGEEIKDLTRLNENQQAAHNTLSRQVFGDHEACIASRLNTLEVKLEAIATKVGELASNLNELEDVV